MFDAMPAWNVTAALVCGLVFIVLLGLAAVAYTVMRRNADARREMTEMREEIARLRREVERLKSGQGTAGSTDVQEL
jgi:cell division protein FtsB